MPIQPGLALQLKGAELPDPMAQFAQATQIQNALQQQRMGEMQIQNAMREQQRTRELEGIMSGLSPTAPAADVAGRLQQRGFFQQAGQVLQQEATRRKTQSEEQEAMFKAIKSKLELTGRLFNGVVDQATYSTAREKATALGLGTMPEVYDPKAVKSILDGAIAVDKQLELEFNRIQAEAAKTRAGAAASQAQTAAQRERREADKAAFERANPGFTIQETDQGLMMVDKRTGVTKPLMLGGERAQPPSKIPTSAKEAQWLLTATPEQKEAFYAAKQAGRDVSNIIIEGQKLTPLQQKADEKFADDYNAWKMGGGVTAAKNVAQIKSVMDQLHEGKQYSGPMIGITPDVVLAFTNPNALDARQRVEQVAQESLRSILGAQFTQKEGEAFIARVYDPKLKPEQNAARLRALFTQLQTAAEQKQAMVDYADENGTLRGFKGKTPSIADFYDALEVKPLRSSTKRGAAPEGNGARREVAPGVFVIERP